MVVVVCHDAVVWAMMEGKMGRLSTAQQACYSLVC